jgi:hypothetical protein
MRNNAKIVDLQSRVLLTLQRSDVRPKNETLKHNSGREHKTKKAAKQLEWFYTMVLFNTMVLIVPHHVIPYTTSVLSHLC